MKRRVLIFFILLAAALAVLNLVCSAVFGRTYMFQADARYLNASEEDLTISYEEDADCVELIDRQFEDGVLSLTFRGVHPGRVFVVVSGPEGISWTVLLYVHPMNNITEGNYFGMYTGARVVPDSTTLFLAALLVCMILKYRRDMQRNMYQYRNIRDMGLILFLALLLVNQILQLTAYRGLITTIRSTMSSVQMAAYILLPVSFIGSAVVTVSNLVLLRREGRTWRNMLGCIIGVLYCLGMLLPFILGELLQRSTVIDVHNEQGAALYVEMAIEGIIFTIVVYLACVLAATIILGVKSARHIPKFDKDYILILGCKVRRDGTLTPLLRGRADRAVEFARMQQEAVGKPLIFVPSGGKGGDETVSEAEAIRNYLVSQGIPEEQIMMEDRSANTYENLGNSMALIRAREGGEDAKVAFSTTNYHVMRSGLYATKQGFLVEGIGSRTKSYFWINAFFREFVATLQVHKRTHVPVMLVLVLVTIGSTLTVYWSNRI